MFTSDDVRKRCRTVYDSAVTRHRKKLLRQFSRKNKGAQIEIPSNQVLPYSFQDFFDWVWRKYGTRVVQCPWCSASIDFRTMQFDHIEPLSRGGSLNLDNLAGVCEECNALKGEQGPEEFRALINFFSTISNYQRKYLEQRIRAGAAGNRMRFFPHKKKEGGDQEQQQQAPRSAAKQERIKLDGRLPF
jgi:5-methylcytosine-specific restriction endonuclease McrA